MTETKMRLEDWLDDLCVRFIINLPREELESVERICFQVEEAQWFYEDFIRPLDPNLPSLKLRDFALRIFQHCPLMSQWSHYHHSTAFSEFLVYKTRVPVRGAILLNQDMDEVVLVKGWKKAASWSFPRGKINKEEKDLDCAAREVYEETGFDIKAAGLIQNEEDIKYIEIPMREQNMRLYVLRGVPKDARFEPRTRKEISKIEWYKLSDLPTLRKNKQQENVPYQNNNKFYMVAPFLGPLKKWIAKQRKLDQLGQGRYSNPHLAVREDIAAELVTEDEGPEEHLGVIGGYSHHLDASAQASLPLHSDLPEVSAPLDPSVHLKRLLNIGSFAPTAPSAQPELMLQHPQQQQQQQLQRPLSTSNAEKGNALLQLLRKGSEPHFSETQPLAPIPVHPTLGLPSVHSQQTTPQPIPGQGFPAPTMLEQITQHRQNPPLMGHSSPQAYGYAEQELASRPHHGYGGQTHDIQARRPFAAYPPPFRSGNSQATHHLVPPPYHRTGDPQFASGQQLLPSSMPSVPPANALPLPKLNSHSLALLSVFRGDHAPTTAAAPSSTPPQPAYQADSEKDAKAQHKQNLLKLLNQPTGSVPGNLAVSHTQFPAELGIQHSPKTKASSGIRPPALNLQGTSNASVIPLYPQKPRTPAQSTIGKTTATLSAPLNLPNFEGIAKSPRSPRRDKSARSPAPAPMANIKILPRPPATNNETPSAASKIEIPPPTLPRPNVKLADLTKPFKPKILRRPDKDNLEAHLPTSTVTVSAFSNPDRQAKVIEESAREPQTHFQRPSQSSTQKETLLSLFHKDTLSPSLATSQESKPPLKSPVLVSPPFSKLVSPATDPFNSPKGATDGNGSDRKSNLTSPTNQAFLLEYLEGVAMGKK